MKIPKFWALGSHQGKTHAHKQKAISVWGHSNTSQEDAENNANKKAESIFDRFKILEKPDSYAYTDRPLREEIVKTFDHEEQEIAIVTRNAQGCLILNTESVMFIDIDTPYPKSKNILDTLLKSLSKNYLKKRSKQESDETLSQIQDWAYQNKQHTFRLYKTFAGYRLLFTDNLYQPTSDQTKQIMQSVNADPLYIKLTTIQECFRARLTPKPYRCGTTNLKIKYPPQTPEAIQKYSQWTHAYNKIKKNHTACKHLKTYGDRNLKPQPHIQNIITLHDSQACLNLPLA